MEYCIIDKGVVEFSQAEKAEDRRKSRALRRRYKRRNHRLERLEQLYKSYHLPVTHTQDTYLLEKRKKALKEQLELQDIVNILGYFARRRGYIAFEDGENEIREGTFISQLRKEEAEEHPKI